MSTTNPSREEFREAACGLMDCTPEEADHMYDLLTGPEEAMEAALEEWVAALAASEVRP